MICAYRGQQSILGLLTQAQADLTLEDPKGFNCLDYAIFWGNYELALYFNNVYRIEMKDDEVYFKKSFTDKDLPLFDVALFLECLKNKTHETKVPSFKLKNKRKEDLMTKLPDPDESWGSFFNRMLNLELYRPPMVDPDKVPIEKTQTLFFRMQNTLLDVEYDRTAVNEVMRSKTVELENNILILPQVIEVKENQQVKESKTVANPQMEEI